jgi:chorismate-pyruvate lyase
VQTPVLREGENRIDSKDIVTLSTKESNKAGELEKISYNLRDVILKGENQ